MRKHLARLLREIADNLDAPVQQSFPLLSASRLEMQDETAGHYDWDLVTGEFAVDDKWLAIVGFDPGELILDTNTLRNLVAVSDRELTETRIFRALAEQQQFMLEFRVVHKDGSERWVRTMGNVILRDRNTGAPLRVQGAMQDIHSLKLGLRERDEFLKFFQQSSLLMLIAQPDGKVIKVNQATLDTFGYTEAEHYVMNVLDLVHPDDIERTQAEIKAQQASGQTLKFENRCRCKNGSYRWLSYRSSFDAEVNLSYITALDITDSKQMEESLRRMQKLNSLGVLAGGIAHDFNNILTILFGNIGLARSLLKEDHQVQGILDRAEIAFHRATHLTGQLLTFAKGGEPVKEDLSIEKLIRDVVLFDLSGSRVKPVFEVAPDLWRIKVDKGQISQVFSNLTTNALQAMPTGGHLTVRMNNVLLDAAQVPGLDAGRYLRFSVADDGVGINRDNIERIFDPYFTTKDTGSGLGLALVHSILRRHGGHVSVVSEQEKGSEFILYLPASSEDSVHTQHAGDSLSPTQEFSARILLLDDEDMIFQLCNTYLSARGFELDRARDGGEAIKLHARAKAAGKDYDCLIMDLTIPGGMSGKEAMAEIRDYDVGVKAIVSSGYAADPVMANYNEHGFNGCIPKPFKLEALEKEIKRVLSL